MDIQVAKADSNFYFVLLLQVELVSKKEKTKQRPQALNTVEMLRVASSALGNLYQHVTCVIAMSV